jgi:hypothetical protein
MSLKFSLRFLIAVVTIACVLVGVGVNFPGVFWDLVFIAGYLAPAAAMSFVFTWFSSQRLVTAVVTTLASLAGALAGAVLFSSLFTVMAYSADSLPPVWELYFDDWLPIACCSTIGASVAGIFLLQFFPRGKPRQPS